MKDTELKKGWAMKVANYKKSGETNKSAWCRRNGVSIKSFGRWYRILEKESVAGSREIKSATQTGVFLPVISKANKVNDPIYIKIGRVTMSINENIKPEHLAEVLKVVTGIC